jgi:transposase-like protein
MSAEIRRWTRAKKLEVVLRLFRGESLDALSREVGVAQSRLEGWRDKALRGMEAGLKEREGDPVQAALDEANRRVGELVMEVELLREKDKRSGNFSQGRSKR